jgi:L-ascorbate metabolism protein UlaG (beta-lactamase superfamily)
MATTIGFFGVAAYELVTEAGRHVLVDLFLDENSGSTVRSEELERVDLVLVTHAAFDPLGDTEAITRRTGAPVVCGGEVKAYLTARGLPEDQIRATAFPCHTINSDHDDIRAFQAHLDQARAAGETVPRSVVLHPGEERMVG